MSEDTSSHRELLTDPAWKPRTPDSQLFSMEESTSPMLLELECVFERLKADSDSSVQVISEDLAGITWSLLLILGPEPRLTRNGAHQSVLTTFQMILTTHRKSTNY